MTIRQRFHPSLWAPHPYCYILRWNGSSVLQVENKPLKWRDYITSIVSDKYIFFYTFKCLISLQFRNLTRHRMLRSGCISWAPMKMKLMKLVRPVQSSSSHIRPIVSGYQNIFATFWIGVVIQPDLWVPQIHDYRFSIVTHSNYVGRGAVSVEYDWAHVLFDSSCRKKACITKFYTYFNQVKLNSTLFECRYNLQVLGRFTGDWFFPWHSSCHLSGSWYFQSDALNVSS